MKKAVAVLLAILVLLLVSCSDKNEVLRFDKYSSYEPYFTKSSMINSDKNGFIRIERNYCELKHHRGIVMSVYVYDETVDHSDGGHIDFAHHTLTKAEIREIYFVSDMVNEEQKPRPGETVWLLQNFYTDEAENKLVIESNWATLMIPGVEYLIYTFNYNHCCNGGNYLGSDVYYTSQLGSIPLSITLDEYAQILENNGFVYVEHDDICEKAIEKYINGNK